MADTASDASSNFGMLALALTLAVAILGAVGFFVLQQRSNALSNQSVLGAPVSQKKRNTIVLTGPMGTGKTALYTQLKYKKQQPTQTSMAVNASEMAVDTTRAFVVDVPGHQKFLFDRDAQLAGARGVVFVVDSVAVASNVRETAEQLYEVLANSKVQEMETPVLVLCNKQDEVAALTNTRVRKLLEDEIDSLRGSRQAALDALGDTAEDDARAGDFLGYDGKKFSFEDVQNDVQFNECVLVQGHDRGGVTYVENWIVEVLS